MTTIEEQNEIMNSQKIDLPFTEVIIAPKAKTITIKKKIETNIQEQSIPQIEAMNTEVEPMNAQATAFVAEAKKKNPRQKKTKMVVEADPVEEPVIVDTIPEPELEPIVEVEAEEEEDDEVKQAREVLEKAERKKLEKDIRTNILEHRKTYATQTEQQRQAILTKIQALNIEQLALQAKFVDIDEGTLDEEIVAIQLVKNKKTKGKREIKLPEYVRPPNYASQHIPADTILVSKLGGEEMRIKYDGNKFINEDCGMEYETLRKATIAFTLAMNKKSIPDAWTFWKTADGKKINRLDLNPL